MTDKLKVDICDIAKNLKQLDEQSLLIIDSGAKLLLARQNIDKDESQQDEPLAVVT